jgi:hypothetical protein
LVTVFDQAGFDARLEWGVEGARVLAGAERLGGGGGPRRRRRGGAGRELAALGRAADVHLAAEHDLSRVVPVRRDGAFTAA